MLIHMNVDGAEAEDCVQEAILSFWKALEENRIENPKKLHTYLLSTCRNTYLNRNAKTTEVLSETVSEDYFEDPQQLRRLVEEERWAIVHDCIDELNEGYRTFIKFWYDHPKYEAESIARHFKMSVNNAWTRKHRIIKILKSCFQKKIKE